MEDRELRSLVLKAFYDRRKSGRPLQPHPDWFDGKISAEAGHEINRICNQLAEDDYIEWSPSIGGDLGFGMIKSRGSKAIEGGEKSEFVYIDYSVAISGNQGNINFGGGDVTQSIGGDVSAVIDSIESDINLKPEEKNQLTEMVKKYGLHLIRTVFRFVPGISGNG